VKLFPAKAALKGVIVEYRDLWKIRSSVGKVCNGDFDIVDFDQLIHVSVPLVIVATAAILPTFLEQQTLINFLSFSRPLRKFPIP